MSSRNEREGRCHPRLLDIPCRMALDSVSIGTDQAIERSRFNEDQLIKPSD